MSDRQAGKGGKLRDVFSFERQKSGVVIAQREVQRAQERERALPLHEAVLAALGRATGRGGNAKIPSSASPDRSRVVLPAKRGTPFSSGKRAAKHARATELRARKRLPHGRNRGGLTRSGTTGR